MLRKYAYPIMQELAWLLCSWAFSFLVTGFLVGYRPLWRGFELQQHNTYFVLTTGSATAPLFLFFATVITSVRALNMGFRQPAIMAVLGLLTLGWVGMVFIGWLVIRSVLSL